MTLKFIRRAFAFVSAAAVSVTFLATPAQASSVNWDAVAQCESSGNWSIDTGNGFYGGLQISHSTWVAYGGEKYAHNADEAGKSEQIDVADRILSGQGIGAWPVCGARGSDSSYKDTQDTSRSSATPKHSESATHAPVTSWSHIYTVRHGDTLFGIGMKYHTSWEGLWISNKTTVHNPNLIFPGEKIQVP